MLWHNTKTLASLIYAENNQSIVQVILPPAFLCLRVCVVLCYGNMRRQDKIQILNKNTHKDRKKWENNTQTWKMYPLRPIFAFLFFFAFHSFSHLVSTTDIIAADRKKLEHHTETQRRTHATWAIISHEKFLI